MRITPLDIQQQRFHKVVRGFDPKEVGHYLELLSTDLEAFIREHNELKEQLSRQHQQLHDVSERERLLQETMITAQKMTVDLKSSAQKEAEAIVAQAQVQAERIINMAYQRLAKLIDEINEMKRERARVESDLRGVLDTHLKLLEVAVASRSDEKSLEDTVRLLKKS